MKRRFVRPRLALIFALLAAAFGGRAGFAQITVSGGSAAHAAAVQAWCVHRIPAAFRPAGHDALPIRLLSPRQMRALVSEDDDARADAGRVDGLFQTDPPRIALRVADDSDPDFFTLAHEYGHFVWSEIFSKDDRRRYEDLYKRQRDAHSLVTRYAASGCEEGFAEAFSFYVSEPVLLQRRDPVSARFFSAWADAHSARKQSVKD